MASQWTKLEPADDNSSFSLDLWRKLSENYQKQIIRYWLQILGLQMPSQARLDAWLKQLRGVHQMGTDRNVQLKHGKSFIYIKKGRVLIKLA